MFESLMKSIGLQIAKYQFRNDRDTLQPMTNFLSNARNVLVVLPVGYDEAILASDALSAQREKLSNIQFIIVHNSTRFTSLAHFPKSEVIRLDPPDINKFFLPRKAVINRLPKHQYDVAIDLNVDFVLYSAYICKASQARVRVGFAKPEGDIFYNVHLQFSEPRTPEALYDKFVKCLSMF
ncbi:MAG: glycosyltransferase family 9 protein [Bacteroidota bacterium]